MKFGVREICDVVLKRKAPGWFGKLYLEKGAPVLYFDTLKTSNLEGSATTVYAQGGKGNPRLVSWDGDRVVTFTMEDALISPESFSVLSGAGFMNASEAKKMYVHTTEQVEIKNGMVKLSKAPATDEDTGAEIYVMLIADDGSINTNFVPMRMTSEDMEKGIDEEGFEIKTMMDHWKEKYIERNKSVKDFDGTHLLQYKDSEGNWQDVSVTDGNVVLVDYYVEADDYVKQIEIEAGEFGGSYYLEASTLWRDQGTGKDYPAEFVIPNCRVQSNFNFTMASSGDPSTFTFTMDAFPDYTKFDKTKKVIAALQIVEDEDRFGKFVDLNLE